jgi:hypothetical protein
MGVDQQALCNWYPAATVNPGLEGVMHVSRLTDLFDTHPLQPRSGLHLVLACISIALLAIAGLILRSGHEGRSLTARARPSSDTE